MLKFKFNSKTDLIPALYTCIFTTSLILARSDFEDDMYRATSGHTDFWFQNARPLSVWLYRLLFQGYLSPDISPLNFILASCIVLFSSLYISRSFLTVSNDCIRSYISICFLSSPYLLSILSYKYDCMPTALALWLSCIFVLYELKQTYLNIAFKTILLVSIFCLYQPALSFIIGLVGLKLLDFNSEKEFWLTLKKTIVLLLIIIISFLLYKIFISNEMLGSFYKNQAKFMPFSTHSFTILKKNIIGYGKNIYEFVHYPYVFVPLTLLYFLSLFNFFKFKFHKKIAVIISFIFVTIAGLSCNIVLMNAAYQTREMLGVTCLFLFPIIVISAKPSKLEIFVVKIFTLGLALTYIIICYAFLNYKDELSRRNDQILQDLNTTIDRIGPKNIHEIQLTEKIEEKSKKMSIILDTFPIIDKMANNTYFSNIWYAKALINEEANINYKISSTTKDFQNKTFTTCFLKSKLNNNILYISAGNYCK